MNVIALDVRIAIKDKVADKLLDYASNISNYQDMHKFQTTLDSIMEEYDNSPHRVLSTGILIDKLDSFTQWLPSLITDRSKIIPLLVSNMIRGDMVASTIYRAIHESIDKKDMVITYSDLHMKPELRVKFNENGGDEPALAIITAEYWLTSKEAAEMFTDNSHGNEVLCLSNELLEIHNDFTDCYNH